MTEVHSKAAMQKTMVCDAYACICTPLLGNPHFKASYFLTKETKGVAR